MSERFDEYYDASQSDIETLEQEVARLRQELDKAHAEIASLGQAVATDYEVVLTLRQELEQARVNEGEAMLVLEGTEAKLEEAKRQLEATDEAGMVTVIAKNECIADLQADIDSLRQELEEAKRDKAKWHHLAVIAKNECIADLQADIDSLRQEREEAKRDKAKWHHLAVICNGEKESRDYWQEQAVNRGMLVDALQAENEKLRAALRRISTEISTWYGSGGTARNIDRALRIAQEALAESGTGKP